MKLKNTLLVLLAAAILAAGVFTIVSADTTSIWEFFGFKKPTQTAAPAAVAEPKSQSTPKPDANPFSSQSGSDQTGLGLNDWDDPYAGMDPALIEWDADPSVEAKSGASLYDDPFADSFSPSRFDSVPSTAVPGGSSAGAAQSWNDPKALRLTPTPTPFTFYRFQNNPVFCPIRTLPCTGFPTGKVTEIRETVSYAATNMTLSIPVLDVNEEIVIVPLVEDNFPVESLGSKIGLLEGSGPTVDDLFVLAGHNHLNTQEQGPFAALGALKESDLIFVRGAKDSARTFVVYANEKFAADDIEGLLSYARPGCMILITCEDESVDGGYLNRRVVFAEAKED